MMLDRSRSRGDVSFASRHIQQPVDKKRDGFSSIKKNKTISNHNFNVYDQQILELSQHPLTPLTRVASGSPTRTS